MKPDTSGKHVQFVTLQSEEDQTRLFQGIPKEKKLGLVPLHLLFLVFKHHITQ